MKIEIAHDILAHKIYARASAEDKMRLKIHNLLKDRFEFYQDKKVLLSKSDLQYFNPYLDSIELSKELYSFVEKSKKHVIRRKRIIYTLISITVILLIIFNGITYKANIQKEEYYQYQSIRLALLEEEEEENKAVEEMYDSLYQELIEKNPNFTKQLIQSYDTLKQAQNALETQKNIAQSSTLSNLAQSAWDDNDINYSFQLAAKAWELNKANQHACELLYKIDKDAYSINDPNHVKMTKDEHDLFIKNLINKQRSEKGRGRLNDEHMTAIFNEQNTIVNKKKEGVRDKIEHLYDKVENTYKKTKDRVFHN